MNVIEIIKSRRTIHDFDTKPIPPEVLHEAFELAAWAPNHRLTLPWAFYEFSLAQKEQIADHAVTLKARKKPDLLTNQTRRNAERQKYLNVPHLIWVLQKASDDEAVRREDYASVACGVQNFSLYLWSKNIGTKWTTGAVTQDLHIYQLAKIDNAEYVAGGFLWVGYPTRVPPPADRHLKTNGSLITVER